MTFAAALASAGARPSDPDQLAELARAALEEGEEERALPLIARALESLPTARLWQWRGLLERSLDEHESALASFAEAARLAPADPGIAHGLARVALESGVAQAEELYEAARRLAPADGAVLLGLAAARLAAGRGDQAEADLDSILEQAPLWVDGHLQLAQLRSMLGRPERSTSSLERSHAALPDRPQLWQALFDLEVRRKDFAALDSAVGRARQASVPPALILPYEAIAAAELGETERSDALFAQLDSSGGAPIPIWRIRHLLRSGRAEDALPIIDSELAGERAADAWPYAAIAWRLTGDPRFEWLASDPRLVSVTELARELPPLDRLADVLRSLHVARGQYLDQSVRGGTQTDGPLFSRIEPEIRALRSAVVAAVERHVAQLPPHDPQHPLLSRRRDRRIRFAGSWSVRLRGSGFHASHVHPQGWISSALYIALPEARPGSPPNAGWLTLGDPPTELGLDLPATASIEPVPGRLVLFPSWMWHGTIPFPAGERLTVAFDVAQPR